MLCYLTVNKVVYKVTVFHVFVVMTAGTWSNRKLFIDPRYSSWKNGTATASRRYRTCRLSEKTGRKKNMQLLPNFGSSDHVAIETRAVGPMKTRRLIKGRRWNIIDVEFDAYSRSRYGCREELLEAGCRRTKQSAWLPATDRDRDGRDRGVPPELWKAMNGCRWPPKMNTRWVFHISYSFWGSVMICQRMTNALNI